MAGLCSQYVRNVLADNFPYRSRFWYSPLISFPPYILYFDNFSDIVQWKCLDDGSDVNNIHYLLLQQNYIFHVTISYDVRYFHDSGHILRRDCFEFSQLDFVKSITFCGRNVAIHIGQPTSSYIHHLTIKKLIFDRSIKVIHPLQVYSVFNNNTGKCPGIICVRQINPLSSLC